MPEGDPRDKIPFVDTGIAPEIFATALHDVEFMGPVCRFTLYSLRRSSNGDGQFKEANAFVVMPTEAVGPAIALTWQKMPSGVIVPTVMHAARGIFLQ